MRWTVICAPGSAPSLRMTRPEIGSPGPPARLESPGMPLEPERGGLGALVFEPELELDPEPEEFDPEEFDPEVPDWFPELLWEPLVPTPGWTGFWPDASLLNASPEATTVNPIPRSMKT